ncbi:MAG: DNA-binding protein WhiA [Lachnospiraceae bacterium]|nr:DNA-binding protein WhiA [Lachnospiraceae bacterium]
MSFSADIKEELAKVESPARHCQIAELAAIVVYAGAVKADSGALMVRLQSDNPHMADRCSLLLEKLFSANQDDEKILQTIKYKKGDTTVDALIIKSLCCKRAFLRGAFLSVGSMSNPEKGYHLEFVCGDIEQAEQLVETMMVFDIRARIVARKKYQVVYIKESEEISTLLNVIGAHISLMNLENLRILKDMRNAINRKVNCEAANITKTVNAATKQIEDIQYIKEHYGFDNLAENLRQIAELRLEYPDATLKELGQYLTPNVGKSGVNHRLRKLSELAEQLRGD